MSLEHGILGYLSIKSLSGYDLKKLFEISAAFFWPADQAQIYRALKKLVEEGSVEQAKRETGKTVDKKTYEITDKGRLYLHDWIVDPKISDFISRLPFLMQLFFSGSLNKEEQILFLDTQLKINRELIEQLHDNYNKKGEEFARITEISVSDPRFKSAVYTSRWGILRGEAYEKLLLEMKEDLLSKRKV